MSQNDYCSQSTVDSARNIHVFIRVLCIKAVNYVKPIWKSFPSM